MGADQSADTDAIKVLVGGQVMKTYNITVNGKAYEVGVEEVGSETVSAQMPPRPVVAQAKPAVAVSKPTSVQSQVKKAVPEKMNIGESTVSAPLPGTVLDIKVAKGDSVADGQVLMILEAMKMENEIMAPCAGEVININVNKGASVNSGDVMIIIG